MANVKITDLPAVATLTGSDVLPIVDVDASTTKKATIQQIVDLVPTGSSTAELTSIVDAEGYFTSSNVEGALEQLGSGLYGVTGSVLNLHVNTTSGDDTSDGLTPSTALRTVQKAVYTFKPPGQPPYWSGADIRYIHVTGNITENIYVPEHAGPGVLVIQSADEVVAETGLTVSTDLTIPSGSAAKFTFNFTGGTLTANEYSGSAFVVPDDLAGSGIKDAWYETLPVITNGTNSFTVVGDGKSEWGAYYWANGTAFSVYQPTAVWTTPPNSELTDAYYDYTGMIKNAGSSLIVKGFILSPSSSAGSVLENDGAGWDSGAVIERCKIVTPGNFAHVAAGGDWMVNAIIESAGSTVSVCEYSFGSIGNSYIMASALVSLTGFDGYIYSLYANRPAGGPTAGLYVKNSSLNDALLEISGATVTPAIRFQRTEGDIQALAAYTDDTDCAVLIYENSNIIAKDPRYFTGEARGAGSVGVRIATNSKFAVDDFWNPASMEISGVAGDFSVGREGSRVHSWGSGSVISDTGRESAYIQGTDRFWWGLNNDGKQVQGTFERARFEELTGAAQPSSGYGILYTKTDGFPYWKNDSGIEYNLSATGSALAGGSDNTITRWDGTTNIQSSSVFVDDSGHIYPLTSSQTNGLNGKEWDTVWTKKIDNSSGSVDVNAGMYVNGNTTFAGNVVASNSTSIQLGLTGTPWYRFWVKEAIFEEIAEPATPAATKGALYTSASVPGIFFKNSAGQVYNLTSGSGAPAGTGSVSGTGSAKQVTFYESASVITGSALFTFNGGDVVITGSLNVSGGVYFHTASANRSGIIRNSNNGDIEFYREGDRKFYMDEFYGIVMDDDIDASTNINFDIGSISAGFRTFYIQNITAPSSEAKIQVRKGLHITGSTYVTNDADSNIALFKVDTSDESVHIGARTDNLDRIPATNFSISSGSYVDMKLVSYDNSATFAPYFYMCRGSGTIDVPGYPDTNMLLGYLGFAGYNQGGAAFSPGANIQVLADENWGSSNYGSRMVFYVVENGGSSDVEKLRLQTTGVTASADVRVLGGLSVSGSAGSDMITLSASATVNTDAGLGNVFELTLTSSCTLANPTNLNAGYSYMWILKQDAGGGNTLSYGSSFKFPGGITPTLSTGSNAVDIMSAVCDGTNLYCTVQTNFS